MKNICFSILIFCTSLFASGQGSIPNLPPLFLNSLFVEVKTTNGIIIYNYNYKNKKIENKEYSIYLIIDDNENEEVTDILEEESDFSFGKMTGYISTGTFLNNRKNGIWKTTYNDKLLKQECWQHGLIIDKYRVYNTKNEILYSTSFGTSGNGIFKDYYYEIGKLKEEGRYKNGKKEGEWCTYLQDGTLDKQINYTDGTPDSN
ncbi:hypothetical protein Celal_2682 [Cellulophaga algicola DSM 14237]|uniref:MORN variant repeat-containing protein n=1 Tax=Cellulophaga algicola (strain DSM 14237 / IC166 / ACAM 630) TaxID=688270 RepID=E6XBA3_CELAD|nr:hypothetical protein [Cellulophaga algicola]ADV49967.1 hypothetical protein Celal_2682 [Cellulophaga algicola DSM 14237]